jgi:lipoprotein-anchoring transpeptidase ErfK/SrfK
MVRNESVTRILMLLFFGTAMLFLAVGWRISSSMSPQNKSAIVDNAIPTGNSQTQKPWNLLPGSKQNAPANYLLAQTQNSAQQKSSNSLSPDTQLVVDLSDRRVYVYRWQKVIASYPIGVGKKGWETPTGAFEVMHMQHNPIWRHPITGKVFPAGTDSPLGDRWIGFWSDGHHQIGFHGTPNDELVGSAISHGCLRMRNSDVRLLYKQVSLGTLVEVRD